MTQKDIEVLIRLIAVEMDISKRADGRVGKGELETERRALDHFERSYPELDFTALKTKIEYKS